MADLDAGAYLRLREAVAGEVRQLRGVLEAVEAVERERVWLRHQSHGDLDDAKLVDGAAGDRAVFKRRGAREPPPGTPQRKPKRLRFAFDCSASMAKFDPEDRRLARSAAVAVLVMEALAPYTHKYDFSIVGHNGDSPCIEFTSFGSPPRSDQERFDVIRQLYAGTACRTGDHTLAAVHAAVAATAEKEADDYFVVVVSDANIGQYGVDADNMSEALKSDPKVTAHFVFIADDHGARSLAQGLPPGRGHVVLDTADLPKVFRRIFESSILRSQASSRL
eukprot:TRINITY_DN7830_c2_g2_i2.p2 TRINITY_DN7830_c2_g2~~TRINITY_DN7830_c2_g2_i2.p2  ORF type:complete len:278 (+),score=81.44 TRINITY_DN7830_c2_g2_i2:1198-2031(+)